MSETSKQVTALVDRLERWLVQQPEWPACFLGDRQDRRRASTLVAQRLFTLPTFVEHGVVIDRTLKRRVLRELRKAEEKDERARLRAEREREEVTA